jgi:predicted nucleic acid-binding protein
MTRVLVDTNVYCDAMRGRAGSVAVLRQADEILLCPVVVGELLAGFGQGGREAGNRASLRQFLGSPRVRVVPLTAATAEFYAHVLAGLRARGTPIPTNDIWIAASAMEQGASLATSDRHFESVPGLLCVSLPE